MKPAAYLEVHQDQTDARHPMNVVDLEFSGETRLMAKFKCPAIVLEASLAHRYETQVPKTLNMISNSFNYLIISGAKAQTNWHRNNSGTSAMYCCCLGTMYIMATRPTEHNKEIFELYNKEYNAKYDQSTIA
jgi:hypothetical protein